MTQFNGKYRLPGWAKGYELLQVSKGSAGRRRSLRHSASGAGAVRQDILSQITSMGPGMDNGGIVDAIAALPCWSGPIQVVPLSGGLTNRNYQITERGRGKFVVRRGEDIPVHGILRFNELAAARAAFAADIGPEVVYASDGFMVSRFVEGLVLAPESMRSVRMLERICGLLRRCHGDMPKHFQGPTLIFWVFQVIRGYIRLLSTGQEPGSLLSLTGLESHARRLEAAIGRVSIVFCHNDLLAANLIDDGDRLWLIDWDYGGFNSPLFDLANLASNNQLGAELEQVLLEQYFDQPVSTEVRRGFDAMVCASLLREMLWGAVSHRTSTIDFDFLQYAEDYRTRFERRFQEFEAHHG